MSLPMSLEGWRQLTQGISHMAWLELARYMAKELTQSTPECQLSRNLQSLLGLVWK